MPRLPSVRSVDARNALVVDNLPMAYAAANRASARWRGIESQEFVDLAIDCLMRACDLYRPALGFKLSTYFYSAWWRALWRFVQDHHKHTLRTAPELALLDVQDAHDDFTRADDRMMVKDLLRALRGRRWTRERRAIRLRFWRGMGLAEIGREMGISKERVRQLIDRALEQIRAPAGVKGGRTPARRG